MDKDSEEKEVAEVFHALSSEVRIKIIKALQEGPKTWSELMFSLKVNPKILDESLKKLIKAGVVVKDKNKYRLTQLGDYILSIINPLAQLTISVFTSFVEGFLGTEKKRKAKEDSQ